MAIIVDGALQVIPQATIAEPGELKVAVAEGEDPRSVPSVIQSLLTDSGVVQVIYNMQGVDKTIEALQNAKKEALENPPEEELPVKKLEVASSMGEAKALAAAQESITKGK